MRKRKLGGSRTLGRPRLRWEHIIKYFKKIKWENMDWIYLE
jgi:hypothetical protein